MEFHTSSSATPRTPTADLPLAAGYVDHPQLLPGRVGEAGESSASVKRRLPTTSAALVDPSLIPSMFATSSSSSFRPDVAIMMPADGHRRSQGVEGFQPPSTTLGNSDVEERPRSFPSTVGDEFPGRAGVHKDSGSFSHLLRQQQLQGHSQTLLSFSAQLCVGAARDPSASEHAMQGPAHAHSTASGRDASTSSSGAGALHRTSSSSKQQDWVDSQHEPQRPQQHDLTVSVSGECPADSSSCPRPVSPSEISCPCCDCSALDDVMGKDGHGSTSSAAGKRKRCGQCGPCRVTVDCGECRQCVHKAKLKQVCIHRKCDTLKNRPPIFTGASTLAAAETSDQPKVGKSLFCRQLKFESTNAARCFSNFFAFICLYHFVMDN